MSDSISKTKSSLFEFTKCNKCLHYNAPYQSICENCKAYLREKIVNIDLWITIQKLIESPSEAFRNIVFAEHKTFIFFLLFFISIKNLILARFISIPELGKEGATTPLFLLLFLSVLITTGFIFFISFIQSKILQRIQIKLRTIDVIALNSYTQIPLIFSLVLIFPVELIVLGTDVFSNNPFAFQIKPTVTYMLLTIETMMILWTFILYYLSIRFTGIKKIYSVIPTLSVFVVWASILFLSSKIIFKL
ncbi:MAG: hypothetical protein RBR74_11915 [Ignavibacteriaceae bacterium]|jgi:hypothetical protein|nr:hypothetical protein [Ignavibacteriaceae bacterium]